MYELLLKSGKDLNVNIETCNGYYLIEGNELALILEKVDEQIIAEVLSKQPKKSNRTRPNFQRKRPIKNQYRPANERRRSGV